MTLLQQYMDCMVRGDKAGLSDLFTEDGVLHDSSQIKVGADTIHLQGRMAVEMMFHNRFGLNGGPFKINSISYQGENMVYYFITYHGQVVPVAAFLSEVEGGKIKRLNIYPL